MGRANLTCYRGAESREAGEPRQARFARALEGLGEFFCESAGLPLRTTLLRTFVLFPAPLATRRWSGSAADLAAGARARTLGSRRLGLIGPQQTVFERSAVETADDQVHFF